MGDRGVFSGAQAKLTGKDVRGDLGERLAVADLDGTDCHATDQVLATASQLRLVPGGSVAAATVCVPGSVAWIDNPFPPPPAVTPALEPLSLGPD